MDDCAGVGLDTRGILLRRRIEMRKTGTRQLRLALTLVCALTITLAPYTPTTLAASAEDKISAADVIAKHLESIASNEARSSVSSRVLIGDSRLVRKASNNVATIDGRLVLASQGNKVLFGMAFPSPEYPGEKFGFDGKKFTVGYVRPGVRSTLGNFLLIHGEVFKEGLMGGTLSSAWPLLNLTERKAKVEYSGTEKIGALSVHKLKYFPKQGSDLEVSLYFDTKTFQHVRTQYSRVAGARLGVGGVDNQAGQRALRYKMTEDFSDFRREDKLNLPHGYQLQLEIENTAGNSTHKWEMKLGQFAFNGELDEKAFNIEGN